jgi:WD40 repeat protein
MNQAFDDSAFSPVFSKDGRWFAARSWEGTVVLLQVQPSGSKPIQLQIADRQKVTDARFSPDGHHLITASNDRIIRTWYLEDLETPYLFAGFDKQIQSAAFSEDGRWYVTVSDDNILRVWRMNVDELIKVACGFAGRNLSPTEWQQMPGIKPYHQTCPEFPPGVDLGTNKISAPPLNPGGFVATRKPKLRDDSGLGKP